MLRFAPEVFPLVIPLCGLAAASGLWAAFGRNGWGLGFTVLFTVLATAVLWFFRDPLRTPPADSRVVVAPADGTVAVSEVRADGSRHVAIFMSVFNVHVNRIPLRGRITDVTRMPGTYFHAGTPRASGNARVEVKLESDFGPVAWRQISGLIARRIACRLAPGDGVSAGERFGIIYFGSRMEVELPSAAQLAVNVGDRVRAGESIIARFPDEVKR